MAHKLYEVRIPAKRIQMGSTSRKERTKSCVFDRPFQAIESLVFFSERNIDATKKHTVGVPGVAPQRFHDPSSFVRLPDAVAECHWLELEEQWRSGLHIGKLGRKLVNSATDRCSREDLREEDLRPLLRGTVLGRVVGDIHRAGGIVVGDRTWWSMIQRVLDRRLGAIRKIAATTVKELTEHQRLMEAEARKTVGPDTG